MHARYPAAGGCQIWMGSSADRSRRVAAAAAHRGSTELSHGPDRISGLGVGGVPTKMTASYEPLLLLLLLLLLLAVGVAAAAKHDVLMIAVDGVRINTILPHTNL
eukprot:SAG31_NODE_3549_length_4134_cov_3.066171_4_plen_105_part_00